MCRQRFSCVCLPPLRAAALFALATLIALPQTDTGSISGVVTDSTGAVVPAALVTITQTETNVRVSLVTNGSGFFSAQALRPGHYDVEASKNGFQSQRRTATELRVQDRLEINFNLALGSTTTEVTVTGQAQLLESETSSLGQVVESKTINDLPLNGRSFIQLATLTAGTLPSTRTAERDNFISNGARAVQNSYLLDGIDNKNRIMGFAGGPAEVIEPVIDGIEEFKVQTSTFSAEFGQAAGGVVNVTMRSGTNQFHGNLFEFLRNSDPDAKPYFQPAGVGKPIYEQNQFGATFGGPIVRNRTFFFASWQSSRELAAAPQVASVPTAAEHQGIFPSKVTDPTNGQQFPNNAIPVSRFDPVAAGLFALYPLPNLPGTVNNFSYDPKERLRADQYNVKGDHHFRASDSLFARFSQGWGHNVQPPLLPAPANGQGFAEVRQRELVVSETHTVSSNKINEFRFGLMYTYENQDLDGPRLFDQYGIKGALDTPTIKGLPTLTITGLTVLGTPTALGAVPVAATGTGNMPAKKAGKIYQLLDNFSWIHDRHAFKFGVDLQRVTMFAYATNSARPPMTFNGTYTGSGPGDFLLGYVFSASTSQQQLNTIQQYVYNAYVQDDWKVTDKLTLNLGVRYELTTPFWEEHNYQSNYVTDQGPCYLKLILVSQDGQCNAGLGRAQIHSDNNNFAPRVGFAFQATPRTVVRGGAGIFYGRDEDLGIANRLPTNPPFVSSATFTGSTTAPAFFLQNGFPANALGLASGGLTANSNVISFPFNFPVGYVEQWNINVERQFPGNFLLQAGYTGSEGHKFPFIVNLNQALPGPGAVNSRRPYQGIGNINYYGPLDNSTYNALIAKLERRFSRGLSLLASYTYGHSIDGGPQSSDSNDPTPQDVRNLAAQKGSSNFDVRQRFALSGFWQIPIGGMSGWASHVVRNWQLSAIFSAQTGQYFTPTLSTDPSSTGTTAHPNRIGNGNLPSDQQSRTHWFDTSAFTVPACVCFGNSGRDILIGPGFMDLDLGIIRDFPFRERFRLQFRAESFNLMNHPNLGLPNGVIGNPVRGNHHHHGESFPAESVRTEAVFLNSQPRKKLATAVRDRGCAFRLCPTSSLRCYNNT